ncbi:MAG: HlyC/CorC family transporter [Treponema sp.]|nr:HlyC/CorC family transporter [Treponema sp.]
MNLPLLIIAASVLILFSMIFSATESAFLSINKLRVRFLRNKRNKTAMRIWRLLSNKERLINTLLVGNNIVNISLSAILSYIAIRLFGNAGVGIATFVTTMLLLIFGEITPKTIATHHPEPIAFFFSGFISVMEVLLAPLVFVFTKISRLILSPFKINTKNSKVSFTEEEIKSFIDVSSEQGILEKNEKNMMHRVFKFTDLAAKDIMIPRKKIKALKLTESYNPIIELSERYGISRFPVYKDDIDDIVGILYIKDLLFYKDNISSFSVQKVMRPPLFILETKKMSSIQQMLRENKQSMAVVIDEYSGTYGVLTTEDIAREIFGPISDEYKSYAHRIQDQIKNPSNSEVDGLSRLSDLNDQLHTKLLSQNCETIGGYIMEALGHIPQEGESITKDGFAFAVSKMEDKRIARVHIRQLKVEGEE